ncbi:rhomboid family intramembrane serine protease [Rubricoccus marinus]|uniref:rhomboid family intramembrane serine protease n=1 Tax=Rubricoccus marinus TaxID=716817 RepID=UPI000B99B676|nr:rhomboid family intramembrane serine protease [Rubricoccus marinus]
MLFPLSDDDRRLSGPALVTWFLILANVGFFFVQAADAEFTYAWSTVPYEITSGQDIANEVPVGAATMSEIPQRPGPGPAPMIYLTLITSMFMHGGLMHIGGNMLYLWIFGDNVEHRFGHAPFLVFYLVSGLAASFAQIALDPDGLIPSLGASGAISGVLGAYLVLFPRNKVNAIFFFRVVSVPAFLVLGVYIVFQFVDGWGAIFSTEQMGGVAYGAHIGGFVAGALAALVYRLIGKKEQQSPLSPAMRRDPQNRPMW